MAKVKKTRPGPSTLAPTRSGGASPPGGKGRAGQGTSSAASTRAATTPVAWDQEEVRASHSWALAVHLGISRVRTSVVNQHGRALRGVEVAAIDHDDARHRERGGAKGLALAAAAELVLANARHTDAGWSRTCKRLAQC